MRRSKVASTTISSAIAHSNAWGLMRMEVLLASAHGRDTPTSRIPQVPQSKENEALRQRTLSATSTRDSGTTGFGTTGFKFMEGHNFDVAFQFSRTA